jgi:hypothetical protein
MDFDSSSSSRSTSAGKSTMIEQGPVRFLRQRQGTTRCSLNEAELGGALGSRVRPGTSGLFSTAACRTSLDRYGSTMSAHRHVSALAGTSEKAGDLRTAARLYADAARSAPNLAERHHLTRQAARISHALPA